MSRLRWGDAEDDDDVLPDSTTVGPNDKGIITKTEYFKNNKGDAIKRVTKIQMAKVQTRVYEITAERKKWAKFGLAAQSNQGVTAQHFENILFERTNIPKKEEKKDAASAAKVHMEGRSLMEVIEEKKRQRELARAKGLIVDGPAAGPGDGGDSGPPKREGVYVPPTRKLGMAGETGYGGRGDRPPDYSLRVSNLSETVTESDLRALFGKFGDISRACVVFDRETGEHRGFAFVNFRLKSCAEKAIEFLDGFGYENMILRVEMAAPREQR